VRRTRPHCRMFQPVKGRAKRAPASTTAQRLAALDLQQECQREALRSKYGHSRSPGNHCAPKHDTLVHNTYYQYFHSNDDDEPTARRLLGIGKTHSTTVSSVDLTSLKPQSAKLYVKYEKLYHTMKSEDDEFFAFRNDYLRKEKVRLLEKGGTTAAQIREGRNALPTWREQSQMLPPLPRNR
jgi:hypothetical protein